MISEFLAENKNAILALTNEKTAAISAFSRIVHGAMRGYNYGRTLYEI